MSVALQFSLTVAGQTAAWNAKKTGLSLDLTHIQMGSGNRAPNGLEVALVQPQEAVAIAGGSQIAPNQVRMSALFSSMLGYEIREIGLWSGNPAAPGSVLVGYWSQAAGVLAVKAAGVDFIFSHDMVLDGAVPAGAINVLVDTAQAPLLAMIAAHEAKADPHPQYVSKTALQVQSSTAFTTAGAAGALTLAADPVVTKLNPGLRLRVKFHTNDTGADTLNLDALGPRPLKQYDGGGAKVSAKFFVGQLGDVEYDGAEWVLLDALPPFDLTGVHDFGMNVQMGVTANAIYTPSVTKARGEYLVYPYSCTWTYNHAGGSYFITAFGDILSGVANCSTINMSPDGLPAYDRSPLLLRILSPTATVRFGIKNNGSTPPGLGTVGINPGIQGVAFYGRRIG